METRAAANDMNTGQGGTGHEPRPNAHRQVVTEELQDLSAVFELLSRRLLNLLHGLVKRLQEVGGEEEDRCQPIIATVAGNETIRKIKKK